MIQIHTNSIEYHPILSQILGVVKVGENCQIYHKTVIDRFGSVFTAFKTDNDRFEALKTDNDRFEGWENSHKTDNDRFVINLAFFTNLRNLKP